MIHKSSVTLFIWLIKYVRNPVRWSIVVGSLWLIHVFFFPFEAHVLLCNLNTCLSISFSENTCLALSRSSCMETVMCAPVWRSTSTSPCTTWARSTWHWPSRPPAHSKVIEHFIYFIFYAFNIFFPCLHPSFVSPLPLSLSSISFLIRKMRFIISKAQWHPVCHSVAWKMYK